jgi:hypothetical protein
MIEIAFLSDKKGRMGAEGPQPDLVLQEIAQRI